MAERLFALEPLARQLRIPLHQTGGQQAGELGGLALLATRIGVGYWAVAKAQQRGLTERQADRWAVACGHHPATIWPTWWDYARGEGDDYYGEDPACEDVAAR